MIAKHLLKEWHCQSNFLVRQPWKRPTWQFGLPRKMARFLAPGIENLVPTCCILNSLLSVAASPLNPCHSSGLWPLLLLFREAKRRVLLHRCLRKPCDTFHSRRPFSATLGSLRFTGAESRSNYSTEPTHNYTNIRHRSLHLHLELDWPRV